MPDYERLQNCKITRLQNYIIKAQYLKKYRRGKVKVKSFEDLQVWQDARAFGMIIYELTSSIRFNKDYGLKDQIQRASVLIMNNISEGFEKDPAIHRFFGLFKRFNRRS